MTSITLLNTRPLAQQQVTYDVFINKGFKVINCPCIEIQATDNEQTAITQLANIKVSDVLIFTSQHAVKNAFKLNPGWNISKNNIIIAVGSQTAECLEQNTSNDVFVPHNQNSEGVIELLKGLNKVSGIVLISAAGGRQEIQNFARKQHIDLQQINVYKRVLPKISNLTITAITNSDNPYILATSKTTLRNLKQLIPASLWYRLLDSPVVCASERIQIQAKKMGFIHSHNLETAKPELIADKLIHLVK